MKAPQSRAIAQSRPALRRRSTAAGLSALLCGSLLALCACSPAFLGGAAVGVLGTGGAYEYNKKRELDTVEREFERGKISKEEYLRRKKQIEDQSVVR